MQNELQTLCLSEGTIVYRQGDPDTGRMYAIQAGQIGLFEGYGTSGQTMLAELGPEDFFGELDMIEGTPRSHTAVVLEDAVLAPITAQTFQSYFADRPAQVLQIMVTMSRRTRVLTKRYMDLCRKIYADRQAK